MNATRIVLPLLLVAGIGGCTEQGAGVAAAGEEPRYVQQAVEHSLHLLPSALGQRPGALEAAPARPRLAIVLSSGGLRGFAHVGVLRVLQAQGIQPDLVVGSSVGALVGAVYASGRSAEQLREIVADDDFRLGAGWLRFEFGVDRPVVHEVVRRALARQRIEQFPIGFAAVATEMRRGCMAIFNAGSAAIAAQASAALPGAIAPTAIGDHLYADGGITAPVPVRVARALGAERVIAVDVTFRPSESRLNGLVDRLFQMGLVLVRTLAAQEASEADVLIEPQLPPQEQVHVDNRLALIAAGERAAVAALPQIERLLAAAPKAVAPARDLRRCEAMSQTS